jgi:kinetochore protein Spc7/SPC105
MRSEVAESKAQIEWLQERKAEISAHLEDAKMGILDAERILRVQGSSTRSEVFRLKGEV